MKKGDKYNITLQAANFSDILEYCTDRHLREEVFKARNTRCYGGKFDNRKNCIEIVNTKLGIAKLLGYENTAQKILGFGRMRHNADEVFSLIGSMVIPAQEATKRELEELKDFIKS
jgi:peptidyl-dipeptidase Dcp